MNDTSQPGRDFCYRCHKAKRTCVCETIPKVDCKTPVHIVQHPRESHHPVGSLRFCALGLERVQVHVAESQPVPPGARSALNPDQAPRPLMLSDYTPSPGACLVYPSAQATPIDELATRPSSLVFVDGTWATVRALLRGDPRLTALPHVSLRTETPQRYRIRREPKAQYMSTLEAVVRALIALEPERQEDLEALLGSFDTMVDHQVELMASLRASGQEQPRHRSRTGQRRPTLPANFSAQVDEMVIACVETTQANRRDAQGTRARRELIRVSARRLRGGPVFDAWVRIPGLDLSPQIWKHMGADAQALATARPLDEVAAAFREAFELPDERGGPTVAPPLAAWNQVDLDLLPGWPWPTSHAQVRTPTPKQDMPPPRDWVLKGLVAHKLRGRGGSLKDARERAGLPQPAPVVPGRNGQRLASSLALCAWLLDEN